MKTEYLRSQLLHIAANFTALADMAPEIARVAELCTQALRNGRKILFCGNGGSAADSQHLAAELVGRYKLDRPAMRAVALTVDTSILTAVGNDYGYQTVFSRQVQALGDAGDVLIGLSTSGNSQNILQAMELAKHLGLVCVAFTGQGGGKMLPMADAGIAVPSHETNHIQEMHIAAGHLICELIERDLYGEG